MSDSFLIGVLLGITLGWLGRPLLRWWLIALEWREASREADIAEELLRRMAPDREPAPDPESESHRPGR